MQINTELITAYDKFIMHETNKKHVFYKIYCKDKINSIFALPNFSQKFTKQNLRDVYSL